MLVQPYQKRLSIKKIQVEKLRTDGPTDLAQILNINLVRGFNHERDILGLKSIFVKNYGSRPFGDPHEHGNEAG